MGRQLGKTIWICFGHENGLDMMLMKWMSINVYIAKRNESKVIFLDEDDNTHIFTISDYAAGHGEGTVGALGMDSWGIRYLLLGDLSVFKNKLMTSVRIYTTDGYFDFKIKKSAAEKARDAYSLFEKEIQKGNLDKCLLKAIMTFICLITEISPIISMITDMVSMCLIGFFFISLYTKINWKIEK